MSINRNKRSVTLDPSDEDGRDVFRNLAADADVLVEKFRSRRWPSGAWTT